MYVFNYTLIGAIALSFITSYMILPILIKFLQAVEIVGFDIMKREKIKVADMGGPGVIAGVLTGVFFYIAVNVFKPNQFEGLIYILAGLNTMLIITLIGIFDVITGLMVKREGEGIFEKMKRKGIPAWAYFLLPLPAAIPLVAVNAGVSHMSFPFLGRLELGVLYPLVCIPIAVLCCSNATNFFAGFNGLEAGTGFILHTSLGLYAYINEEYNAALIALTFAASLLAFLKYNWYPAKVFPGDLNYTIGAATVCVAVIGNIEKFAIIAFIPWIIEAFLKALSGFKAESFGLVQDDNIIKPHQKQIRSLTHLIMKISNFKEWQVSLILIIIETAICIIAFIITPII